jgi:hypothetical protein
MLHMYLLAVNMIDIDINKNTNSQTCFSDHLY